MSEILFFAKRLWCVIAGHYRVSEQVYPINYLHCSRCNKRWIERAREQ